MSLEKWMEEKEAVKEGAKEAFRDWLKRNHEDLMPHLQYEAKEGIRAAMTEWLEEHHEEVLEVLKFQQKQIEDLQKTVYELSALHP